MQHSDSLFSYFKNNLNVSGQFSSLYHRAHSPAAGTLRRIRSSLALAEGQSLWRRRGGDRRRRPRPHHMDIREVDGESHALRNSRGDLQVGDS